MPDPTKPTVQLTISTFPSIISRIYLWVSKSPTHFKEGAAVTYMQGVQARSVDINLVSGDPNTLSLWHVPLAKACEHLKYVGIPCDITAQYAGEAFSRRVAAIRIAEDLTVTLDNRIMDFNEQIACPSPKPFAQDCHRQLELLNAKKMLQLLD